MGSSNKAMWDFYGISCTSGPQNIKSTTLYIMLSLSSNYSSCLMFLTFKNIKQSLINNIFFEIELSIVKKYSLPSDTVQNKYIENIAVHQDNLELK